MNGFVEVEDGCEKAPESLKLRTGASIQFFSKKDFNGMDQKEEYTHSTLGSLA